MKRFFAMTAACFMALAWLPTAAVAVGTSASCAILMEYESGRVLYSENIHEMRSIASITKLMTALVAVEQTQDLSQIVTVGAESCEIEGSSIYLRPGEQISVEALLYGLLLRSGNDAASALAVQCGGSVDGFVALMNEKAQTLGMEHTHFTNPSGLSDENHYSTAYDMALLTRACLANETVSTITATKNATYGTRVFSNHNKLLWRYEGCIGMKTGFTKDAGRTLVSAVQRGGMTLIVVTLNDGDDWKDHAALFDYGFSTWAGIDLAAKSEVVANVPVTGGLTPFVPVVAQEGIAYPFASEEAPQRRIELNGDSLSAPIIEGAPVGRLVFLLNGEEIAATPLLAGETVPSVIAPKRNIPGRILDFFGLS